MKPGIVLAAFALAAGLCGRSTSAATAVEQDPSHENAFRRFLWEQTLAFMRARGDVLVPKSPYDPFPQAGLLDARTHFERAGARRVTQPIRSTTEQLWEQAVATTYRGMLDGGGPCCPCSAAASCQDGLFCNGDEICAAGNCATGATPCVDGDPCTTDSCTENTDVCSFTPVPPPAQVARLDVSRVPSSTVANLAWSAVPGASTYNVYRGAASNLGDLACFQGGVTGTSQNDDGAIPGPAFYFLVSSLACSESDLGTGNPGLRPPAPGCP